MLKYKTLTYYMSNADPDILSSQRDVFRFLEEPIEQVEGTITHGQFLTEMCRTHEDQLDAMVFFDVDCVPLKSGIVERAVKLAIRRNMVIGCAQQAEHLERDRYLDAQRDWPWVLRKADAVRRRLRGAFGLERYIFKDPLIYAGPCFLVVPLGIYAAVGRPTLEATSRADVGGELTIACREHGITVHCLQPTSCVTPKWKLGNQVRFGLGTEYGRLVFHAFESRSKGSSLNLFIERCNEILNRTTVT